MRLHAEQVSFDDDEGRYLLRVWHETGLTVVDIHDVVLAFYAEVQKHIRPYVLEAEHARMSMPQPITNRPVSVEDAIEAGYALDDPKSPGYHDRMVD